MPEEPATGNEMNRREFLMYAWLASIALLTAGTGGVALAYSYPRFKEGEFGGRFVMGTVDEIADGSVTLNRDGKFFLVRNGEDYRALYQVCTHLGCLVRETESGFACPCHGSRFAKDGTLVASPAPRDMDRFEVQVENGQVIVNTGQRTRGESRTV